MALDLSPELRGELGSFITARLGLHFPPERSRDLDRGVVAAARELGFSTPSAFVEHVLSSPPRRDLMEVLAGNLTVGETYFFRHPRSYKALERYILPELISRRQKSRQLRIWSAGCATGEEPYSVAILLKAIIPDLRLWNITVLATDINAGFLKKASRGQYGEWSFRDAPAWLKGKYFTQTDDGRYELLPEIRSMVTFFHHNLAEDTYPSVLNNTNAMDVILCRNVLMYFTTEVEAKAVQGFRNCLVEGGSLLVSPCELSTTLFSGFDSAVLSGATIYSKRDLPAPAAVTGAASRTAPGATRDAEAILPKREWPSAAPASHRKAPARLTAGAPASPRPREPAPDPRGEARRLYDAGRYRDAEAKILSLSPLARNDREMMELLARVYANQGNLPLASEWSARTVAADKLNSRSHYLHATILEEQGRIGEAAEALKHALYLEPDFVLAHFSLGNLQRRRGRVRESKRHFKNALLLLKHYPQEAILTASEGLTAGRLAEIILTTSGKDEEYGG